MKNFKRILANQKGFTLIEIIAVLVILGILAAVAIPRYLSMQEQAKINAAQGALGSGASQLLLTYSSCLLVGSTPTGIGGNAFTGGCTAAIPVTQGDFTVAYAAATGGFPSVNITITTPGPAWLDAGVIASVNTTPKTVVLP